MFSMFYPQVKTPRCLAGPTLVLSCRRNSLFDGSFSLHGAANLMNIQRFCHQLLTGDENFPVIFPDSREFGARRASV
jgi:hypothetical protein